MFQIGGVEPHCGIDVVIAPRQLHRHLRRGQVTAGIDDQTDAKLGQSGQEGIPVAVKPAGVIMGMGVEEHRAHHLYHGDLWEKVGTFPTYFPIIHNLRGKSNPGGLINRKKILIKS